MFVLERVGILKSWASKSSCHINNIWNMHRQHYRVLKDNLVKMCCKTALKDINHRHGWCCYVVMYIYTVLRNGMQVIGLGNMIMALF